MTEKRLVVEGLTISYEGYFHCNDLFQLLRRFTKERGYDQMDKLNEVIVKEDGRYITIDLRPEKGVSDYVKNLIQIKGVFSKITDEEIEIDGKKVKINKGSVKITLNGYSLSDYEGDWMSTPFRVFMKTIYDKFIYGHHTKDMDQVLKDDIQRLRNEISSFLNLHKYIHNT